MKLDRSKWLWIGVAVVAVAGIAYWLAPKPVPVDVGVVSRGPLRETVEEDGETRVRLRYVVSAPVAGRLERIELDEGDPVEVGTTLARLHAVPLTIKDREQAEAQLDATIEARRAADAEVRRAESLLAEAERDLRRSERLAREGQISQAQLEDAQTLVSSLENETAAARYRARAAAFDVENARAALRASRGSDDDQVLLVSSPAAGQVLRVMEECECVVSPGTPLIEVGDPGDLEVVIDVLSTDAVRIEPGARCLVTEWGGDSPLEASVRLVEPSGFTKISPLGVEEQRVNVIADFQEDYATLGDRFRVEAELVLWESDDVLRVPTSALFREGEGWSVFVVEGERAVKRPVEIGHRNARRSEVLGGLSPDQRVVLHPSDRVRDGVGVTVRSSS